MSPRNPILLTATLALAALTVLGCERDTSGLRPVAPDTDPVVFGDAFGKAVDFQAFLGSKLDAVSLDGVEVTTARLRSG